MSGLKKGEHINAPLRATIFYGHQKESRKEARVNKSKSRSPERKSRRERQCAPPLGKLVY